jgi:glutamate-1-semialdehyde 2,1-aminomutase
MEILDTFLRRTPESSAIGRRAERVMPGGDTRAAGWHLPYPLTFVGGQGARITDLDGHTYLDLLGNYTSLVHGHAYPPIVDAVQRQIVNGTAWAGRNLAQIDLAEQLCERVASVDRVRFTNSGTEANMLAIQLAKLATGRPRILMARHGYHGSHEDTEAGHSAGERTEAVFGGPDGTGHATLVAEFGDAASFEAVLAEHGDDVAAVILEPVMGSGGVVTPPPGFLAAVQAAAHRHGALFILDEVMMFRLAVGGAQSVYDVQPDLTTFAKVIGGGFPVGAFGGRADLMALADPGSGPLIHTGTFNGNPVTMAAGAVSVSELTAPRIEAMAHHAIRLADGIDKAAADAGVEVEVRRAGSVLQIVTRHTAALHLAALNEGLYFAPRGMVVLSTVMTDTDIDEAIDKFKTVFGQKPVATTGL